MKEVRTRMLIILAIASISFGLIILFLSLLTASPAYRDEDGQKQSRRLYWQRPILPDHLFYPILNWQDQWRIEAADDALKPLLQLQTSQKRLAAAVSLNQSDQTNSDTPKIVLSTLQKSHSYLNQAVESLLVAKNPQPGQASYFNQVIVEREEVLRDLFSEVDETQRGDIERMREEQNILKERIWAAFPLEMI